MAAADLAEIVLGVVCPLGTRYQPAVARIQEALAGFGCRTSQVSISASFPKILAGDLSAAAKDLASIEGKIWAGDRIRDLAGDPAILARLAAREIASQRTQPPVGGTCHVIVQLKRPEEAELLRKIYGPGFYLIGLFPSQSERDAFFREHGLDSTQADDLIRRDQEEVSHEGRPLLGQQTRKTFCLADAFIPTNDLSRLDRFLELVFSNPFLTPTRDERGMFMAFASAFSSGDLSRQVGAALVNEMGDMLAVGYNEVPKAGGGSYGSDDGKKAHRDIEAGDEANHRARLRIAEAIAQELAIDQGRADQVFRKSGLFDITEFGRAVHAEMDAILSCARTGRSPLGATLYVTTFPCHNCTRHLIAAGIQRVVFVEPYPRSKARELHGDAIQLDGHVVERDRRVPFQPFLGVGPRRYVDLFALRLGSGTALEREMNGVKRQWDRQHAQPRLPMLLSTFVEREALAAVEFDRKFALADPGAG